MDAFRSARERFILSSAGRPGPRTPVLGRGAERQGSRRRSPGHRLSGILLERDGLGCGKYATLSQALRPSTSCPPTDHRFSQTLPLFVAISRGRNGQRFVTLQREADITMLYAAEPAFQTEMISPAPLLRLAPNDAPAPIAKLSIAKTRVASTGKQKFGMGHAGANRYPVVRLPISPAMEC